MNHEKTVIRINITPGETVYAHVTVWIGQMQRYVTVGISAKTTDFMRQRFYG